LVEAEGEQMSARAALCFRGIVFIIDFLMKQEDEQK
jgi:hypothetical protein